MFQLRRPSSLKEVCIFVSSLTLQNTLNDVWTPLMKIATSCASSHRNSLSNWLEAESGRDSQVGEYSSVMSTLRRFCYSEIRPSARRLWTRIACLSVLQFKQKIYWIRHWIRSGLHSATFHSHNMSATEAVSGNPIERQMSHGTAH